MIYNPKLICLVSGIAAATSVFAAEPSAFEIRNYAPRIENTLIKEVKFEAADKKLYRAYNGVSTDKAGIDGSNALVFTRQAGKKVELYATVPLPQITAGTDYVAEVMVRGENLKNASSKRPFYCLAAESRVVATGKMANWRDGTTRIYGELPGSEFRKVELNFKGKKGLQPFILLTLPGGFEGTLCFDDLKIYKKGLPSTLTLTAPALQMFRTDNGKFEVSVTTARVSDPLLLAILHRDKKILRSVIVRPDLDNVFRGDFGKDLEEGEAGLMLIFADAASKEKIGTLDLECSIESIDGE